MSDRRRCKGLIDDLLPDDIAWCRETWADRSELARLSEGAWMLRHCADRLGIDQSAVDDLLRERGS